MPFGIVVIALLWGLIMLCVVGLAGTIHHDREDH